MARKPASEYTHRQSAPGPRPDEATLPVVTTSELVQVVPWERAMDEGTLDRAETRCLLEQAPRSEAAGKRHGRALVWLHRLLVKAGLTESRP
jgi:hypothetical protein